MKIRLRVVWSQYHAAGYPCSVISCRYRRKNPESRPIFTKVVNNIGKMREMQINRKEGAKRGTAERHEDAEYCRKQ